MRLHFIGIGGIGVSALAQYYLVTGHQVSGSDLAFSEIIKLLRKQGARIFIGPHKAKNLSSGADKVIYSPAVQADNPELKEAKRIGIKCSSYPEALGELTKKYFTIAVAGTHGKSTTTAMLAMILIRAGLDPTVIVGTKLREFCNFTPYRTCSGAGSNFRFGKSRYLVIEACEHEASFLNYWPKIIVITNIEREHLDYYKNLKNILKAFREFVGHLPREGILVLNKDDKNILRTFGSATSESYRLRQKEVKTLRKILKVPGEHNVYNALAALTVARALKIPDEISFKALSEYKGSWRRFEIIEADLRGYQRRLTRKITVVLDYGHHPTEIKATLKAARQKYPGKKIWCVYQPHQYQRTYYLFDDFVKVFKQAPIDRLIITDIYDVAGREEKKIKEKINSKKVIEAINRPWAIYLPQKRIINYLKKNIQAGEVVFIMGAGDIYKLVDFGSLTSYIPSCRLPMKNF